MAFTASEDEHRRLLRARDAIDRSFARPLDVALLARVALMSPAHFSRRFRGVFGEPPHRYLQRRRIERACAILRDTRVPVTEVSALVGFESVGTFGRTFRAIMGRTPSEYRAATPSVPVPQCFVQRWTRPSSFGGAETARLS